MIFGHETKRMQGDEGFCLPIWVLKKRLLLFFQKIIDGLCYVVVYLLFQQSEKSNSILVRQNALYSHRANLHKLARVFPMILALYTDVEVFIRFLKPKNLVQNSALILSLVNTAE